MKFGFQLLTFKVVRAKFVASAAKEKRSSSIDELKVRRHCHRSSVTAVDGTRVCMRHDVELKVMAEFTFHWCHSCLKIDTLGEQMLFLV